MRHRWSAPERLGLAVGLITAIAGAGIALAAPTSLHNLGYGLLGFAGLALVSLIAYEAARWSLTRHAATEHGQDQSGVRVEHVYGDLYFGAPSKERPAPTATAAEVWLPELAGKGVYGIAGQTFEDVTFIGPGIIAPLNGNELLNCRFEGPLDALVWAYPEEWEALTGVIALVSCHFINCTFKGVAVAVRQSRYEITRRALGLTGAPGD